MPVSVSEPVAWAIPKSRTFTAPSGVSITFPGFTSRWITPRSCAAARARATSTPIATASSAGSGPSRRIRSASVSPSTSSVTM